MLSDTGVSLDVLQIEKLELYYHIPVTHMRYILITRLALNSH